MILSKMLKPFGVLKTTEQNTTFAIEYLNEIKSENIRHVVGIPCVNGLLGYVVFYEDKNVYTCPKCGHDISNTFSFCPNCAHKMDSSVDAPLKCPNCAKDVAYTYTFCPDCGTKLK